MNKRIRSRVLAAGMVSSTVLGFGGFPYLQQAIFAQDKPTAAEQLERGSRLYDQKQYPEAKKVLLDIDPAQLPEDQRGKLTDLLKNTDLALAKSQGASGGFDTAQADLDAGKLASAATGFQAVVDDSTASADVKDKAKIQLALVRQKQAEAAPQMKELLNQAETLYQQGKLDEAQNAVNTVIATGSDLGWQDNAKPAQLQQKIADRRTALANGGNGANNGSATSAPTMTAAAPATEAAQATAPVPAPADNAAPAMAGADAGPAPMPTPAPDMTPAPAPAADNVAAAAPVAPAPAAAGVDPNSALGQTITADEIARQRALTLYNVAMKQSSDALAANPPQYTTAVDRAHEAGTLIDDNRRYFSDAEGNALRSAAARQEQLATTSQATFNTEQQRIEQEKAKKNEADLAKARLTAKQRRVDALMQDAKHFVDTQQYKEAADTLRQIRVIDPTNSSAALMLSLVNDRIAFRQYDSVMKLNAREDARQHIQNAEEVVPYADLLIYPENWVELTRNRLGDQSNQDSAANRAARARLAENIKEISADQQGFEKVINFLRDNTGTNIFVNWKALEAAGIDRNTPVTVSLRDVPFSKALTTILAEVGGTANLAYTIDEGVITISTRDDLNSSVPPRIVTYDIRDLLIQPDNRPAPDLSLTAAAQAGTSGGGGTSLFTDQTTQNTAETIQANRDSIVKKITDAIKSTVAPDSWRDNGGSIGSIQEISGQLLINQTIDNHVAIESLLEKIRETHAVQISIESRIMFVNSNFFEQFGIGWNLNIPAGSLGGNVGAFTAGNLSAATTATSLTTGNLSKALAGGSGTGLLVSGSILDNFQLSLLLQATQADQRTISLASPRITLFNGQRGYIQVTRQFSYISNFNQTSTPISGNNGTSGASISTTLTTSAIQDGVVMQVEAAVSADRRYVVMQVAPQLSSLEGFTNVGSMDSTANATSLQGIFLQLPTTDITTVHTTVSVPDGGTLLIGGEKVVGQSEVEIGVPILSKIPGLNRLFTNRSLEKDERTLLILIRPKIIIQKEVENNLFGPGYDRPTGLPINPATSTMLDNNGIDPSIKAAGR